MSKRKKIVALILVLIIVFTTLGTAFAKNNGGVNEDNQTEGIDPPPSQDGELTYNPGKIFDDKYQGLRFYATDANGHLIDGTVRDYMYNVKTYNLSLAGAGQCRVRSSGEIASITRDSVSTLGINSAITENYPVLCLSSATLRKNGKKITELLCDPTAPGGINYFQWYVKTYYPNIIDGLKDGSYHVFMENTFFVKVYGGGKNGDVFYGSAYEWALYCQQNGIDVTKSMKDSQKYVNNYLATTIVLGEPVKGTGLVPPSSIPSMNYVMRPDEILGNGNNTGFGINEFSKYVVGDVPIAPTDNKTEDHREDDYQHVVMGEEYWTGYIASNGFYNIHDGIPTTEEIDNKIKAVNRIGEIKYGKYTAKRKYTVTFHLKYKEKKADGTEETKDLDPLSVEIERKGIYYYIKDYALYELDTFATANPACNLFYQGLNGLNDVIFRICGEENPTELKGEDKDSEFTREQYHIDWSKCSNGEYNNSNPFNSRDDAIAWFNGNAKAEAEKIVKYPTVKSDYVQVNGTVYLEDEEVTGSSGGVSESKKPNPLVIAKEYIERETTNVEIPYDLRNGVYYTPVTVGYVLCAGTTKTHPTYKTFEWTGSEGDKSHILDGGGSLKDGSFNSYKDNCPIHVMTPVIAPFSLWEEDKETKVPMHMPELDDEMLDAIKAEYPDNWKEMAEEYEKDRLQYGNQLSAPYCHNCGYSGEDIPEHADRSGIVTCPKCNSRNVSRYCGICLHEFTFEEYINARNNGNKCPFCSEEGQYNDLSIIYGKENGDLRQMRLDGTYVLQFDTEKHEEWKGYKYSEVPQDYDDDDSFWGWYADELRKVYKHQDWLGYKGGKVPDDIDNEHPWNGRDGYETTNKYDKYVLQKWVKFPFDVYVDDIYYAADNWIELYDYNPASGETTSGYTKDNVNHLVTTEFYIPSWAEELTGEIEVLVYAVNYNDSSLKGAWARNMNDDEYWSMYSIGVQTSGWVYDYKTVGSYPATPWAGEEADMDLSTSYTSLAKAKDEFFQGSYNRTGEDGDVHDKYQRYYKDGSITDNISETTDMIPLSDGTSEYAMLMGSLPKDSNFSYTINTISNLDKNDYLQIVPTFTWYSQDTEEKLTDDDIMLYYSESDELFIPYASIRDKENAQTIALNNVELEGTVDKNDIEYWVKKYTTIPAGTSSRQKQAILEKAQKHKLEDESSKTLGQGNTILRGNELMLYNASAEDQLRKNQGRTRNFVDYITGYTRYNFDDFQKELISGDTAKKLREMLTESCQTWYGLYNVPGNLYVVDKKKLAAALNEAYDTDEYKASRLNPNTALLDYASSREGINGTEDIFLRTGELVINFKVYVYKDGERYLEYEGGTSDQWQKQGMKKDMTVWTPLSINKWRHIIDGTRRRTELEQKLFPDKNHIGNGFFHIPVVSGDVAVVKLEDVSDSRNRIQPSLVFTN